MHFKNERTFVAVKPDGVQRGLIGEVVSRFERVGLKLVAMKMLVPSADHIEKHYTLDPFEVTDRVLKNLITFMTSGPMVAMVWEGAHAIKLVRKLVGGTEPLTSDVGTIRGDYVLDSYAMSDTDGRAIRNLIHASGNLEDAKKEIEHWFKKDELIGYNHIQDKILYDVHIDGILE